MESTCEIKKEGRKRARFDEAKESRVLMMFHRFISAEDPFWSIFQEKLVHMKELYAGKHAIQLCPVCLTLYVCGSPKKHPSSTIGSLFLAFNPSEKTPKEIAEVFRDNGRIKLKKNGEVLVGVPSFNQICISDHRTLQGSLVSSEFRKREGESAEKTKKDDKNVQLSQRKPAIVQKRLKESETTLLNQGKTPWMPCLKATIPPVPNNKNPLVPEDTPTANSSQKT